MVLAGALAFQLPIATAQEADEEEFVIEEVIVTARKREERLQDVPLSVSVFNAADLEARSANSLSDLANFTPNLGFMNAREGSSIRIRGVGQSDASMFFDPGVAIYVDGVYLARMRGVDLDLLDLERVEVLRGPIELAVQERPVG